MTRKETPPKNTNHEDSAEIVISIFVYGTLKRGYANHDRFCRNAIDIQPATVWGRLYDLGAYPALEVPEESILAHGTTDPLADAATQARHAAHMRACGSNTPPPGDWDLIHGELITFPNPARDLPPLDIVEGYRPGQENLYNRLLVSTICPLSHFAAWIYCMEDVSNGVRIQTFVNCVGEAQSRTGTVY
jgi:gamma-glutamylcyclotransferase (GGCT)/AIG2-like uncharacterized protein YtfP